MPLALVEEKKSQPVQRPEEEEKKEIKQSPEESKQLEGHLRVQVTEEARSEAFMTAKVDNPIQKRE